MSEPSNPLEKVATKAVEKTIEELASGVRDIAKAIGAEAAVETGGILGDQLRYWRWCNRVKILDKMAAKLRKRGVDPKKVLPSEWVPLLEAGSNVDDEQLSEMWATLLANAADPTKRVGLMVSYVDILRQLSSLEVEFLDALFAQYGSGARRAASGQYLLTRYHNNALQSLRATHDFSDEDFDVIATNLDRLSLCRFETAQSRPDAIQTGEPTILVLTPLGDAFMKACSDDKRHEGRS